MSFEELSEKLITHVASIASKSKYCWISDNTAVIVVMVTPVSLALVLNITCLTKNLYDIHQLQKGASLAANNSKASLILICIKLTTVMGLTWVLGLAANWKQTEFLHYPSTLMNSMQDIVIELLELLEVVITSTSKGHATSLSGDAIVIKLLELFEVVITSTVEVLKRPPVSSKGHATSLSGASTPKFTALSIQDKTPECLCEVSRKEPQSFKSAVVEENSLVFEQADVFVDDMLSSDDIAISEVMSHHNAKQNQIPDSNETLYSGAAVTVVSARVWRQYLRHAYPKLSVPSSENITTVNGCRLTTIGKTSMEFVIDSRIFTFEVCVIEDLSFDVVLGRDFLQKFCFKVDFENGLVSFPSQPSPFPFEGVHVDDDNDLIDKAFISSVHASGTFVIPPQSEILISGELEDSSNKYGIDGMIVPKPDLSHRYSIFGVSELVSIAEDGTIPISILSADDKIKFRNIFKKYRDVLAFADAELGRTSLVQHVIDTSDVTPIKQMPYRTSPECKKEIDRQVNDMLERGIVQESVSAWSSPVVLVKKKDGSMRFCVDYRKLKKITRKDCFSLPLIADTLDSLSGTSVFSTIDTKSGYWKIELHPSAR
ncbi:Transposon Ty3-I Gag-Pol polyprotein [Stylophora pistillata]|uniref:Transposon Ty3-I Gag-Pol polyprotein n=1 Tax=Stylophora pistillata TaxID=50429 RepID=A0A2B4RZ46_STYPI|nr:Transposon Ty3-I Gag-Pol polyprotein [Stylophora pistillata]